MRLAGHVHGIVTKTIHKILPGVGLGEGDQEMGALDVVRG